MERKEADRYPRVTLSMYIFYVYLHPIPAFLYSLETTYSLFLLNCWFLLIIYNRTSTDIWGTGASLFGPGTSSDMLHLVGQIVATGGKRHLGRVVTLSLTVPVKLWGGQCHFDFFFKLTKWLIPPYLFVYISMHTCICI